MPQKPRAKSRPPKPPRQRSTPRPPKPKIRKTSAQIAARLEEKHAYGQTRRTKELKFVEVYKATGNLTQAKTESGLANGHASQLIANTPELREDIIILLARCGVTKDIVANQLRRLATSDPRRAFDKEGNLLPMHELDDDTAAAVNEVTSFASEFERKDGNVERETKTRLKLAPKDPSLKELARMLKMVDETVQIANRPGEKFSVETPRESRADVIASLLSLVTPKPDPK